MAQRSKTSRFGGVQVVVAVFSTGSGISDIEQGKNIQKPKPMMQRSLLTLPSLNKLLIGSRLRLAPASINAANITSLRLNKEDLPKQPVPELKSTVQKYLKSVKPLLCDNEYRETERIVKEFERGVGSQLHRKLLERYECTDNWMNEWFLHAAYLGYRIPVIVHSSPGTVGPLQKFSSPEEVFKFAGKLVAAVCEYDAMIKSGKMKQEMAGKSPLDMQPYGMILGTHRRPNIPLDCLLHTDTSEHIIVIHNNQIFKLNVYDESCKDRKIPLSHDQIAASLKDLAACSKTPGIPVGVLTGNHRDTWAKDHSKLEACGENAIILRDIETAMFALCLDQAISPDQHRNKDYESFRALQSLTGVSCDTNAGNRWHDKAVQFIVSYDGFVGMTYEHSPCEGVPIAVLHDHVLNYVAGQDDDTCDQPKQFPKAQHLEFQIPKGLEDSISAAACAVDELSKDIDTECFTFDNFGTDEIKNNKMSPDSFIQMAMQLAYYKLHGKPPAHYESAGLRRFRNTRTECIRSTCTESVQFAQTMLSDETKEKKKEAMMTAINAHKRLAGEAATGQGVDRHLFGLKTIAAKEGSCIPEIFTDVGYTRSTHFTLTSSQVPYKTASFMCYGPVTPDGYACCYNPRPRDIRVSCSTFNACKETCTKEFAEALKESFSEMIQVASEC